MEQKRGSSLLSLICFIAVMTSLLAFAAIESDSARYLVSGIRKGQLSAERASNDAMRRMFSAKTRAGGPLCLDGLGSFAGAHANARACGLYAGANFPIFTLPVPKTEKLCLKFGIAPASASPHAALDCLELKNLKESFLSNQNLRLKTLSLNPAGSVLKLVSLGEIRIENLNASGRAAIAAIGDVHIGSATQLSGDPLQLTIISRRGIAEYSELEAGVEAKVISGEDLLKPEVISSLKETWELSNFLPLALFVPSS